MVYIPGGTFLMGRDNHPPFEGLPIEVPSHPVTVSSFWMDITEVTNEEYADFVHDTRHEPPTEWAGEKPKQGEEKWPVSNVSIGDAEVFATWRSKRDGVIYRLPTEEEWEYAARGGDQDNFYPWGSIWKEGFANINGDVPKPVGSYPQGQTRWGNLDMIGNVWEWTSSRASLYPGNQTILQIPNEQRDWIVARGGSYGSKIEMRGLTATTRDWFSSTYKNPVLGFRLVRTGQ